MFKKIIIFLSLILIIKAKFLDNLDRSFSNGDDKVLEISITMSDEDYQRVLECVQVTPKTAVKNLAQDHETIANITITDNGKVKVFPGSKFKTAGNFAKSFVKPGFNIELSDKFYKRKSFRLRADCNDVSHLRQKIVCDVANRVGLPSIQSTYVRLTINENLYGLYQLIDTLKAYNIKKMYNTETNKKDLNLIQCKDMGFRFTAESASACVNDVGDDKTDIEEFKKFVAEVEKATTVDELDKFMNVDIFLKYIALEWLVGSFDHMLVIGHNFYFYKNEINNKWDVILYDYDNTLGQGETAKKWAWSTDKTINVKDFTKLSFKEFVDDQKIFDIAVNNDDTRFKKNLKEFLIYGYNPVLLNEHIDDLKSYISPYVKEDYTPINGEYPGRVNKLGFSLEGITYESYEMNSEYETISHPELYGDTPVPGLKAWIRDTFDNACNKYGFDKEEILKEAVKLAPTSFFTKIKNGVSPYESSIINEGKNDEEENDEKNKCWSEKHGYKCCEGCNIILAEENGNKWGVENGKWCGIQESVCKDQNDYCESSEYDCCETCNQYYYDNTGRYGYEKGQWCIIKDSC